MYDYFVGICTTVTQCAGADSPDPDNSGSCQVIQEPGVLHSHPYSLATVVIRAIWGEESPYLLHGPRSLTAGGSVTRPGAAEGVRAWCLFGVWCTARPSLFERRLPLPAADPTSPVEEYTFDNGRAADRNIALIPGIPAGGEGVRLTYGGGGATDMETERGGQIDGAETQVEGEADAETEAAKVVAASWGHPQPLLRPPAPNLRSRPKKRGGGGSAPWRG